MKKISRMWQTIALAVCVCFVLTFNVHAGAGYLYALSMELGVETKIYGFEADPETGALTPLPGFPVGTGALGTQFLLTETLAVDPVNGRLFVLNDGPDTLSVYKIDAATGALSPMPYSPIALSAANWGTVAVHPSGSPVIVGGMISSFSGTARSFIIDQDSFAPAAGNPFSTGTATPFSGGFSNDGNYYYAGGFSNTSTMAGFAVDSTTGVLTALAGSPFETWVPNPVGYSADAQGRLFFLSSFNQLRINTTDNGIPTETVTSPVNSVAGSVHSRLHPNGEYLFVAGRSANQVMSFKISGTGDTTSASAVSLASAGGIYTNILALDHAGKFLYASNGQSRNIATMSVTADTGVLTFLSIQAENTLGMTGRIVGMALYDTGAVEPPPPSQTPAERVQAMIDLINSHDPPLQRGIARALTAKLEGVLASLEAGDMEAARGHLRAFMNHLKAQSGKHVPAETADELRAAAEALLAILEAGE
jgi:6-phosphogluconolactonase